jgi:TolB protein
MNADGTDVQRLTYTPHEDRCPMWSPDGRRIAFVSDHYGHEEVWVIDADGTDAQRLTVNGGVPGWSPDGERIAFCRGEPAADL